MTLQNRIARRRAAEEPEPTRFPSARDDKEAAFRRDPRGASAASGAIEHRIARRVCCRGVSRHAFRRRATTK